MQNDIASIKENKTLIESRHTCTEGKRQMEKLVMLSTNMVATGQEIVREKKNSSRSGKIQGISLGVRENLHL